MKTISIFEFFDIRLGAILSLPNLDDDLEGFGHRVNLGRSARIMSKPSQRPLPPGGGLFLSTGVTGVRPFALGHSALSR